MLIYLTVKLPIHVREHVLVHESTICSNTGYVYIPVYLGLSEYKPS